MDKAPLRRGKITVHEKWNTNTAILSGDVMFVKAFEMLLKAPNKQKPILMERFCKYAALVCEGQQWDMDFEQQSDVSTDEYLQMISCKTAALLACALEFGALVAEY